MSKPVHSILNVNSTPDTPIKPVTMLRGDGDEPWGNINFFALKEEILFLYSVTRYGKSDKWLGVCGHFNLRRKLEIELYGADIRMIEAEYNIQIPDSHEFAEPVEFIPHQFVGRKFRKIGQLIATKFKDTVQTALPEPVAESSTPKPKYHGETVTILSAVEQNRGNYKVWTLTARADDGFYFHKITAWSEHRKLFIEAGYPKFPERGEPAIQLNADAVIEYVEGKINDYRVTYVYPKTAQPDTMPDIQPALTVAAQPVRHVIPVTVELSLEEQIAAYYRKPDYTVCGILELVADNVKPERPVLVSMADATEEIPAYPEIMAAGDTAA